MKKVIETLKTIEKNMSYEEQIEVVKKALKALTNELHNASQGQKKISIVLFQEDKPNINPCLDEASFYGNLQEDKPKLADFYK